ncbi:receptor-type tyrosine-protein phosphatase alpha-like [Watersipora subatra]|uniref:receptor-type tyrosine-protein phosphatase alpha-like n=1 Tax=Watersipora subatra TaxID=2589382 RepID=UPI00355B9BA0
MLDIHGKAENGENLSQQAATPVSTEPTYENSTRVLVDQLYERVHEEKRNSPNHPFRDEFKNKCSRYWPESGSTKFGDFLVTLIETTQFSSYVVRKMKYAIGNEVGTVTLCHYTEWYDHDVPSPVGLLSFRARVKQESAASAAPIIVHCSAGVGRTGTYIALEILIHEANDSKRAAKSIDVFTRVNNLRSQRMHMVQVVRHCHAEIPQFHVPTSLRPSKNGSRKEQVAFHFYQNNSRGSIKHQAVAMMGSAALHRNKKISPKIEIPKLFPGYQKKRGFILTQIPMSSTTPEYWRMVVEQKSALVIYLNDCKVHRVKVLEIKTSKNTLPSCQQLVQLCQKAEKYATSGSDTITVQCRNGCRLSGHFLISMNLYMRMRIEQEVDIVLEVNLASHSGAQIGTTLKELEALYKFVEYYLSEFNTYSNFSAID